MKIKSFIIDDELLLSKIFCVDNSDKETIIAVPIKDKLRIFKLIDEE